MPDILPDVLKENLKIVFCGTAAGFVSAQKRQPYAGPGNKFWSMLHKTGLTPYQLDPSEFKSLLKYEIGLTDMAKTAIGTDDYLKKTDFNNPLKEKILLYRPHYLAFNGKRAAQEFFQQKKVSYGLQIDTIGKTNIYILPSTSGAAVRYWDESYWAELAGKVM